MYNVHENHLEAVGSKLWRHDDQLTKDLEQLTCYVESKHKEDEHQDKKGYIHFKNTCKRITVGLK